MSNGRSRRSAPAAPPALLLPAVVDLPPADAARLLGFAAELGRLGLEIEGFGPGAVLVRALPALGFHAVSDVHVGRLVELDVADPSQLDAMC